MAKSKFQLVIAPEAIEDIDELSIFLDKAKAGRGQEFVDQLGDLLLDLSDNPYRFQFARTQKEKVRRALFFRPTIVVLYLVESTEVRILSIKDTRSNWDKG